MAKNWTVADIPNQAGKRAVVTGANSGLGFQTARALARSGAEVVMACRSIERGETALGRIKAELPTARVAVRQLDTSSTASVKKFAAELVAEGAPLDILVNNAGIMALPRRGVSEDGWELQLATNYLGHYSLTGLLLPVLLRARSPRVISISSNAHKRGKFYWGDIQMESNYSDWGSYQQSKLAMLVYARELQRQNDLHGGTMVSVAAHPGLSTTGINRDTTGMAKIMIPIIFRLLGQNDAEGALPQLHAATAPDVQPGGYYGPSGWQEFKGAPAPAQVAKQAEDAAAGPRLWSLSEKITGVVYDWAAR